MREIVAGSGTSILADNIYNVTGNWATTFPNTTIQNRSITTPLVVKLNCAISLKVLILRQEMAILQL